MASRPHRSDAARIVAALERAVSRELPALLPRQRWFGDKGRPIGAVALRDCAALGARGWLVLVDVTFAAGPDQTYAVPLVLSREGLASGPVTTLGVLQGYVANHGDGWSWVTAHLKNLPPERVDALSDDVFRELRGLGAITGELHGALACDPGDADFSPEPIAAADAAAWSARVVDDVGHTCERVRGRLSTLPPELAAGARALVANEAELVARARDLEILGGQRAMKIRVHGYYHLGP